MFTVDNGFITRMYVSYGQNNKATNATQGFTHISVTASESKDNRSLLLTQFDGQCRH